MSEANSSRQQEDWLFLQIEAESKKGPLVGIFRFLAVVIFELTLDSEQLVAKIISV